MVILALIGCVAEAVIGLIIMIRLRGVRMAFYQDFGARTCARVSTYILRFAAHYDEYRNSRLVRSVDISRDVVWC
ncbi:hypothetical protein BGLT_02217 [Caballeronia glathei]|uniref:hypothetical protein n=1 Tax=Caballeronia glathei TaxID=60547 RepID=UPI0005035549|nr:hypothetical protein [Caballeronia glathei]CDY79436.1 hypothetical protein BGLT_02217 [Caballeronia glathei]